MSTNPLPFLVYRINENINAIGATIGELAAWADDCGSAETSEAVRRHLKVLEANSVHIAGALTNLITRQGRSLGVTHTNQASHHPTDRAE